MHNWKKRKNIILLLPNLLSLYRIAAFPIILYFIITGKEQIYALLIVANFITDIADGFLARRLRLQSNLGARMDSMGDNLTYVLAFTGILVFKPEEINPHLLSLFTFMILAVIMTLTSLIKFKRFSSFHLYSFKTGGYIQGLFFITLFFYGFIEPFYYIMIFWAIFSCLEHIAIQLIIPSMRSDIKGIYWVLKEEQKD